jgi:hypothetical protein
MDLFDLKYTEDIYELYTEIQNLFNHYLIETNDFNSNHIHTIIKDNIVIFESMNDDSDDEYLNED